MNGLCRLFGVTLDGAAQRLEFKAAMRDGVQTISSTVPAMMIWAVVTAAAMMGAGMPPLYVLLINLVVYAASAQLAVLAMLIAGAPMVMIWLTACVVNLRFVIFSASLKPYFQHLPLKHRWLYGFLNGDINSMLFNHRYRNEVPTQASVQQTGFFLGMALTNYVAWQVGTVAGVLLASLIPAEWGLKLAAALTLLVLVIKIVDHWAAVVGCLVTALVALFFQFLPFNLWIFLAIIVGVAAALLVETVWPNGYLNQSARLRAAQREVS
jgi:predicted branched-subunit amino acid permease